MNRSTDPPLISTQPSLLGSPASMVEDVTDLTDSSYPASPATRHHTDIDPDHAPDSPPTTPPQISSSEELSKTFVPPSNLLSRNLLQERLAFNLRVKTSSSPSSTRNHTRSSSRSAWSSTGDNSEASPVTPASIHSSSSARSTASSIFERMCGSPKKAAITTLHTEQKSTMGMFTPVSAKTASGSLRNLTFVRRGTSGRPRTLSNLSRTDGARQPYAESSESEDESRRAKGSTRRAIARTTNALNPPTVCLTHSSFQAPSVLDSEYSPAPSDPPSPAPGPSTLPHTPKTTKRHPGLPPSWMNKNSSPGSSSSDNHPARHPSLHPHPTTRPSASGAPKSSPSGFPALDPTLAALEKSCRLKGKVQCVACGTTGFDFPRDRHGRALCSRECRMLLKAKEAGVALPLASSGTKSSGVKQEIVLPMLRAL